MNAAVSNQPLTGRRILEVAHMLAGPYCGMLLADLGAEVIKIETRDGDIARHTGPNYVGPHNVYFASLNRGKKSVLLDLKTAAGRYSFDRLAAGADALVTNLRPAAIEHLGLHYDALQAVNPRLVCVALTGFGLTGPFRDEPAYDYIIQALSGLMMLTGEPDSPPVRAGYSVVDNTGGMMAAIGLLAQLASGRGGQIDVSLYDVMISQFNYLAAGYLNAGEKPARWPGGAHSYFAPAQIFATLDGHLAVFVTHDQFWRAFCQAVERPQWATDLRFATLEARNSNRTELIAAVADLLRMRRTQAWLEPLKTAGVVVAGVHTMADALDDERTRPMIITACGPQGELRLVGNPIKITGIRTDYRPPPFLGEHTRLLCPELESDPTSA